MAIALITTFYGAVLANLFFLPISGKLKNRSESETLVKEMIIAGIMSIQAEQGVRIDDNSDEGCDHSYHPHASAGYGHETPTPLLTGMVGSDPANPARLDARPDRFATQNRREFSEDRIFAANLLSAAGAGKTTLLCRTAELLSDIDMAVIGGDPQTMTDAERIRAAGVPAIQINTGTTSQLDRYMIHRALGDLRPRPRSLVFIENLGNLIFPRNVDLGEDIKVAVTSVTEGEDKPLKYPEAFAHARLAVLSKVDLAPYCDIDLDLFEHNLRSVSPQISVIRLSARTGEGMDQWLAWLRAKAALKHMAQED